MIDAPLFIANTEATLRAIVLANRVAKMIDRKMAQAISISNNAQGPINYQYEIVSPIVEVSRLFNRFAPALARRHYEQITEIIASKLKEEVIEARSQIAKTVFPGLSAKQVNAIVTKPVLTQRVMRQLLRGSSPSATASFISITSNPQERRRLIEEYFRRLRNVAYTSVRTAMAMVYAQVNGQVYDAIPADVIGFQVLGILDNRIRPTHRARHGTIYYKNPGVGRPGFNQMPNPPLEADGSYAYNCRCSLIPVFKGDDTKARDIRGRVIPNARVFSEWFDRQTERARIAIVGVKRYQAAKAKNNDRHPSWVDFLDPKTGMLMDVQDIKQESARKRASRILKINSMMAASKI